MFAWIKRLFSRKPIPKELERLYYKVELVKHEVKLNAVDYTITMITGEVFKTTNYGKVDEKNAYLYDLRTGQIDWEKERGPYSAAACYPPRSTWPEKIELAFNGSYTLNDNNPNVTLNSAHIIKIESSKVYTSDISRFVEQETVVKIDDK
jgi:hypothetical protein